MRLATKFEYAEQSRIISRVLLFCSEISGRIRKIIENTDILIENKIYGKKKKSAIEVLRRSLS